MIRLIPYFRWAPIVMLFLIGAFLFVLPFFRVTEVPPVLLFLGRLHPLVLHFPIVLIILAFLFEAVGKFYRLRVGDNTVAVLLIAAALSSLASVAAGYLLLASGDYSGVLIDEHLWAGTFTGAAVFFALALFYVYRSTHRFYYAYFCTLLSANIAVGYASHLGGSITHGQDYLTEHLQVVFQSVGDEEEKPASEMRMFDDMLLPVFEMKCMSCHNARRTKGNFVMTSYENVLKGGASGALAVSPGDPRASELFKRVMLPEGHADRMPPEGKTPMSPEEIKLLEYWIASGAADSIRMETARNVDTMQAVVGRVLRELEKYRRRVRIQHANRAIQEAELSRLAEELDVVIRSDSLSDDGLFLLAMKFPPAPFTNDQFRVLRPYFDVFSKLSLAASGIDDAGLYYISQMTNVRELYLQKTGIDGTGIIHLQNLRGLEILNLSFTNVDDKAALDLLKIPNLKEVYLYRTKTSMQVIEALRKYRPSVKFLLEEGPYY